MKAEMVGGPFCGLIEEIRGIRPTWMREHVTSPKDRYRAIYTYGGQVTQNNNLKYNYIRQEKLS